MDNPSKQAERICNILLDMGIMLLGSGAHCGRIVRNLERVAQPWGYEIEVFSSFTGLVISMHEKDNPHNFVTRFRRSPSNNVNFTIISEISIASWKVPDESLTPEKFSLELARIKAIKPYARWQVMLGVGFACAALCMVSGGSWENGLTALVASMCGVVVRQEFSKRRFNVMIACAVGAFITSLITGLGMRYSIGLSPESALATSVLYLVPGVPLINSVIDLIEGHIPTSIARAAFASYILLSIAVGMTASIFLIGIQNFLTMIDLLLLALRDAALAFTIAVGFSFLFNTPPNARMAAGLLGGFGHMIRFLLLSFGWGLVSATLVGAVLIGFISVFVTRVVNTPPVVFSMPACITMIPGLYAYRTMLGFIKIVDLGKDNPNNELLSETVYYLVLTASLLFTLAIGITIAALVFRQKTTRNIKLPRDFMSIFGMRRG